MGDPAPKRLGKHELVSRLATGGMAEIHLARQHGLGHSRRVVVKRLLPHLAVPSTCWYPRYESTVDSVIGSDRGR